MPEICRFFGIVIGMFFNDHFPPHFHAVYGDDVAVFSISDLKITSGNLPRRATSLILEWAFEHRDELMKNWQLAQKGKALTKIQPLR